MPRRQLIATWAILGVIGVLATAVARLLPNALAPLGPSLPLWVGLSYVASIVFMAWSEGYRGFQRAYSPRVVARAYALADLPHLYLVPIAPLVAMGLVHATRKRLLISWCMVMGIVILVLIVRQFEQPWRGIIDAGVVVGLMWGVVAIITFWFRAVAGQPPAVPDDMP